MIGALHLVPSLVIKCGGIEAEASSDPTVPMPVLTELTIDESMHWCDRRPCLELITMGLDPTVAVDCGKEEQRSALQMARDCIRADPPDEDARPAATSSAVFPSLSDRRSRPCLFPNLIVAYSPHCLDKQSAHSGEEGWNNARYDRHLQWTCALLAKWGQHSHAVRALLLAAAPSELIPDLAAIVAEYLDLDPDGGYRRAREIGR